MSQLHSLLVPVGSKRETGLGSCVAGPGHVVGPGMLVERDVETSLLAEIQDANHEHRHDLVRRANSASHNPLAFLLTEAVWHLAVATLAMADANTVILKLTTPELQRGELYT